MIKIQASVSKGWLHEKMNVNFNEDYYFEPLERRKQDRSIALFLEEQFPDYRIHNLESNLVELTEYSPDLIYVGGIQPNLILGMLLGADFIAYPGQDSDISETPLAGLDKISDLPSPGSLVESGLIKRWTGEIDEFMRLEDGPVIPPFFWDTGGRATIHGFITTALKFFGQDIFLSIYEDPDRLTDFFRWYLDASVTLIDHFAGLAGYKPGSLHIGECSGTMMGPDDYARFLAPFISEIAEKCAPVRLHFCGNCDHLLDEMIKTKGIASLDTGSGTDVKKIRRIFGREFPLDLMPPVELLLEGRNPADVESWLDEVLDANEEGPLTLNYHLEPGYDEKNHLLLQKGLYTRGIIAPGRR